MTMAAFTESLLRQAAQNDLNDYFKYYNPALSMGADEDSGESGGKTYILDIPASEFTGGLYEEIYSELTFRSHGCEGNAGGVVSKISVGDPVYHTENRWHKHPVYRIEVESSWVLDI